MTAWEADERIVGEECLLRTALGVKSRMWQEANRIIWQEAEARIRPVARERALQ